MDELIDFDEKIKNLPYTAILCKIFIFILGLTLHSLDRETDAPIASTTMPLYNDDLKLR